MAEGYDIIIVGSGAGGGTLAHTLAHTGKRILIVERGGFLPGKPGGQEASHPGTGGYASPETWYDPHERPFQPAAHYFVGGATKLDGESPAWPVSYSEFEPWYSRAEVDHEPVIRVGEQLAARLGCPVASQTARPGTGPRPAEPRTRPVAVSGVS